jgi:hypothetical protein
MDLLVAANSTLSAMITPAVLISACGSLVLTTSQRLARGIERTRAIARRFEALAQAQLDPALVDEERAMLFAQLSLFTRRLPLLSRVMNLLYVALCDFVATSVFIGIDSFWHLDVGSLSVLLAITGVLLLLAASVTLIIESRIALAAVDGEMSFVRRLGERLVPQHARPQLARRRRFSRARTAPSPLPPREG